MKQSKEKELYNLHHIARTIIVKAMKRMKSREKVSMYYGIPPTITDHYLTGGDCGTLNARCVIRVEIARMQALREGDYNFWPKYTDRYKGTR